METMLTMLRELREVAADVSLRRLAGGNYRIEFTKNTMTTTIDGESAAALVEIAHTVAREDLS